MGIQNGYVDYLMPQIYWGFTNEVAPFDKVTDAWCILMEDSGKNFILDSSFIGWVVLNQDNRMKKNFKSIPAEKELPILKSRKK